MPVPFRRILGVVGALIYAGAGAVMGSQNAGWFGLERNSNQLLPLLGVGAALVVFTFASSSFRVRVHETGPLGVTAEVLLVLGCALYVVSAIIQFAIFGTLSFGLGLVCLAIAVLRAKLVPLIDRVLITLSAIGSLTWNTETVSAFLLTGVGLIWAFLTIRLAAADLRAPRCGAERHGRSPQSHACRLKDHTAASRTGRDDGEPTSNGGKDGWNSLGVGWRGDPTAFLPIDSSRATGFTGGRWPRARRGERLRPHASSGSRKSSPSYV